MRLAAMRCPKAEGEGPLAMYIEAVVRGPRMAVGYVAYNRAGGPALIVDAPMSSERPILTYLNGTPLKPGIS